MSSVIIPPKANTDWVIWWDIRKHAGSNWSKATAQTEAGALDRAHHFVRLGFVVYAIRDPAGTLYMDEQKIAERFGAAPVTDSEPKSPTLPLRRQF